MLGKDEPLKRVKELLRKLEPTQESIVMASDTFLLLSAKGQTEAVFDMWEKMFKIASSKQKLAFLYVLNHICQSARKDEGRLKHRFQAILEKACERTYKLCDDNEVRKEIIRMLSIWKERSVFPQEQVEGIEKSLLTLGNDIDKRRKAAAVSLAAGSSGLATYMQLPIPKQLLDITDSLRHFAEWKEKVDLIQESLQAIVRQEVEYVEIETMCKLAEYESAIIHSKKYAQQAFEQLEKLLQSEDNLHLQEVLQMKNMQSLILDIQRLRAAYKERSANPAAVPSANMNPAESQPEASSAFLPNAPASDHPQ